MSAEDEGVLKVESFPSWAERRKEYYALQTHPQLRLAARLSGIEDLLAEIDEAKKSSVCAATADESLNARVAVGFADITKVAADVVVNAAHSALSGGGGVGAIHAAAGPLLSAEAAALAPCAPGDVRVTKGHRLPCRHVVHTVGPYGEDSAVLARCYSSSLDAAASLGARSVAFCCVSAGHYKYPTVAAAAVALQSVRAWLLANPTHVERVLFCVHTARDEVAYEELLPIVFPQPPPAR